MGKGVKELQISLGLQFGKALGCMAKAYKIMEM